MVVRMADEELMEFFGTTKPTRAHIEENDEFLDDIDRGQGIYIIAYENDQPSEIYFAGYSYD